MHGNTVYETLWAIVAVRKGTIGVWKGRHSNGTDISFYAKVVNYNNSMISLWP